MVELEAFDNLLTVDMHYTGSSRMAGLTLIRGAVYVSLEDPGSILKVDVNMGMVKEHDTVLDEDVTLYNMAGDEFRYHHHGEIFMGIYNATLAMKRCI